MQVDHMIDARGGRTLKEFRDVRSVSEFMVSRAVAGNAERFLPDLGAAALFPIPLIALHVLPPRRPQWK